MAKRDYYDVLGVGRSATKDQIDSAYRERAFKLHPDKNLGDKQAEDKFKELNEAYSVLSDNSKKQTYDQFGHAGMDGSSSSGGFRGGGGGGQGFGDLGDIFGEMFEQAFGGRSRGGQRNAGGQPGRDLRIDKTVTLKDVLNGTDVTLEVPNLQTCEVCTGTGAKAGTGRKQCPDCKGRGQVRVSHGFFTMAQTCSRCRGYGEIIENPCPSCSGTGRVHRNKKVKVRIPPGVEDGTTLRISGSGEAGERGAPAGDLYVVVQVTADKRFERDGANIITDAEITFPLAALGGEITVDGLDGKVRLKIPSGTQPGVHFRVAGHGLPHLRSRSKGDLYVRIQVTIPKKMSKEEKKLVQDLAVKMGETNISKDEGMFKKVFGD